MRITIIAHHTAPIAPPFAGGVESLTWYLSRWLAERGHDVTLHGLAGSAIPGVRVEPLDMEPAISATARDDVSMPAPAFLAAHHAYQRLMLELADRADADVIHCHALHYLPVSMACLLDVPVLLTLHTPPTPWLESALAVASAPPVMTTVSQATRRAWRATARVARVIPNGIDLEAWRIGPGGGTAVWCGRGVPEKAPHLAIDAARRAGVGLRLAGPVIDERYWAAEVIPRLGGDIRHVGHIDHGQLRELVRHSSVLVTSPVWDEPFGLVAAEAMASGTPVAAFARGGLRELVAPAGGRLAAADDVAALAAAIAEASALDRLAVRAHAERTLGIDAMGRAYEAVYRDLRHRRDGLASCPGVRRLVALPPVAGVG